MVSLNHKLRELFDQPTSVYAKPLARRIVLCLALFFFLMLILSTDFISDKVFFEVGQVSDRDVVSPRTISYVDMIKTKKLEAEVVGNVANIYDLDVSVIGKAEEHIDAIFKTTRLMMLEKATLSENEKYEKLQQALPVSIPNSLLTSLMNLDETAIINAQQQTKNIVQKYFERGIRVEDLEVTKKNIAAEGENLGVSL